MNSKGFGSFLVSGGLLRRVLGSLSGPLRAVLGRLGTVLGHLGDVVGGKTVQGVLGRLSGPLRAVSGRLETFSGRLGASWERFGTSWDAKSSRSRLGAVLEPPWKRLGRVLGTSWAVLEASWGRLVGLFEVSWAVLQAFGSVWGRLGGILCVNFTPKGGYM